MGRDDHIQQLPWRRVFRQGLVRENIQVGPREALRLRGKLSISVSSQRPATLTQKAMLDLIQQMARNMLAAPRK